MNQVKICIAGGSELAVSALDHAIGLVGAANVLVCPSARDRGELNWQPSLRRFAENRRVRVVKLSEIYELKDLVFISLQFDQIISPNLFATPYLFNIHFSKLPAYKGMYPTTWPILNGEHESGVTLHLIDQGIDTGPLIAQKTVEIDHLDCSRDLYFKCIRASIELLKEKFEDMISGSYSAIEQSLHNSSYYTRSSIDFSAPFAKHDVPSEIFLRYVRAYHFREYQIPKVDNFPLGRWERLDGKKFKNKVHYSDDGRELFVETKDCVIHFFRDNHEEFFNCIESGDIEACRKQEFDISFFGTTNKFGLTPLMQAIVLGDKKMCELLTSIAPSSIDVVDIEGSTPLMHSLNYGIRTGNFSIANFLLDSGASVEIRNRFGEAAKDIAQKYNCKTISRYFL